MRQPTSSPGKGRDTSKFTPSALRAILSVLVTLITVLGLPSGSARAAEPTHAHVNETMPTNLCGINLVTTFDAVSNTTTLSDGTFRYTSRMQVTLTNPLNGKSVVALAAGLFAQQPSVINAAAGTISFITSFKGLQESIRTSQGPMLVRDAGIWSFTNTFDLATGDFISSHVATNGPHPDALSDFTLFCNVLNGALT